MANVKLGSKAVGSIKSFPIYRTIEAWQTDLQPSLVGHVAS